jgi:hypothetical protein
MIERARAEALFKKEEQMPEGEKAMAEYKAAQQAIRDKDSQASRVAPGARQTAQSLRRSAQQRVFESAGQESKTWSLTWGKPLRRG